MPRVSHPGRDLEAERLLYQRRRFRHLAEAEVFDIRNVAGLGPDADFKVGELFAERLAPCLGVADMFVEIDR
jgi:hypothetical protein